MTTPKPNLSPDRLAQLRAESQKLRPRLAAEMPAIREEWKHWTNSLASVVARHSPEIDNDIAAHGPMTRPEMVDKALSIFLSEV
jgi:hypothetical protein